MKKIKVGDIIYCYKPLSIYAKKKHRIHTFDQGKILRIDNTTYPIRIYFSMSLYKSSKSEYNFSTGIDYFNLHFTNIENKNNHNLEFIKKEEMVL